MLVNAGGILNSWKWPEIKGLKAFGVILMHWDGSVDLKGKRVGPIGNGLAFILQASVGTNYGWNPDQPTANI
jgi:hypothetical protein